MAPSSILEAESASELKSPPVTLQIWMAIVGSLIAEFMCVLDLMITNSSLQNIQGALGASLEEGSWITTAYSMTEVVAFPITAWMCKVVSKRKLAIAATISFTLSSILCSLAWDLNSMIVFRAIQGLAGGFLTTLPMIFIMDLLPPAQRVFALSTSSIILAFAPDLGPCIGGWLTETFGWQYIFYLNIPLGCLACAALVFGVPSERQDFKLLRQGNWVGILCMACGLISVTYILEEGHRKDWFSSDLIVSMAALAAVTLGIFLWTELQHESPFLNLRIFFNRNFGMSIIAIAAQSFGQMGWIYLTALYLCSIQGYNSLQIGHMFAYAALPQLLVAGIVSKLLRKIDTRLLMRFGFTLFALGSLMNAFMTHDSGTEQILGAQLLRAFALPFIWAPFSALATTTLRPKDAGSASGLINVVDNLAGSAGIAFMSTFLTVREQFHSAILSENVGQTNGQDGVAQIVSSLVNSGLNPAQSAQHGIEILDDLVRRESYVMAFNDCFWLIAIVVTIGSLTIHFCKKDRKT